MLRSICRFIVWTALASACAQTASAVEPKPQGNWVATKAERDGASAADLVGHRLSLSGNRFEIRSKDGTSIYAGTFRVDPGARPSAISFAHTAGELKGKAWKGIYKLEGDRLTVCDNAVDLDKPRPKTFEAAKGSGYVCITFAKAR